MSRTVRITGPHVDQVVRIREDANRDNWFNIGEKVLHEIAFIEPRSDHVVITIFGQEYKVELTGGVE